MIKNMIQNMFENVGEKIQIVAKVFFWIGVFISAILAIVFFYLFGGIFLKDEVYYLINGIVILVIGPLLSWLGSLFVYGFGELIKNTKRNEQ